MSTTFKIAKHPRIISLIYLVIATKEEVEKEVGFDSETTLRFRGERDAQADLIASDLETDRETVLGVADRMERFMKAQYDESKLSLL